MRGVQAPPCAPESVCARMHARVCPYVHIRAWGRSHPTPPQHLLINPAWGAHRPGLAPDSNHRQVTPAKSSSLRLRESALKACLWAWNGCAGIWLQTQSLSVPLSLSQQWLLILGTFPRKTHLFT